MFVIDCEGSEDDNMSGIRINWRRKTKRRPIKSGGMRKTGTNGKRGGGGLRRMEEKDGGKVDVWGREREMKRRLMKSLKGVEDELDENWSSRMLKKRRRSRRRRKRGRRKRTRKKRHLKK